MRGRIGFALLVAVVGVVALVLPGRASAAKPGYGCAPGMNLGAYTFDEYVQLPRTQAAINDGLIDEAGIVAGLMHYDQNGDQTVCVQLSLGKQVNNQPFGEYLYNVVDNNASKP
jgi:hypothetical protein